MKFVIFKSEENGQWYFHFVARNGRIVLASEGYHRKGKAVKTVGVIARWAGTADVVVKE